MTLPELGGDEITNITNNITNNYETINNITNEVINNIFDNSTNITNFITQVTQQLQTNISINGSCENGGINLTVADGLSVGSTWIDLCMNECDLTEIINKLDEIKDELTIDISGTIKNNFICIPDESGLLVPSYTDKYYSGKGLIGLHTAIKEMATNFYPIFENVCTLDTGGDVVAIVSSDKVINRTPEKQLILHFVTLNNYPKCSDTSSYRPVQIPEPIENLNWKDHFKTLRWHQGTCYCELHFKDYKTPVYGYFENKDAADRYFDAILNLTTLEEAKRTYYEHSVNSKNIPIRETRPYRAFVVRIDENGKPICETKYVPVLEE